MSTPNPYPQGPSQQYVPPTPRPERPFYRPSDGRMLGGVCAAIADHFGWDRTAVRLLTVASILLPGPQVLAYLVLWLVVPDEQKYWARNAVPAPAAGQQGQQWQQPQHPTAPEV